MTFTAKLHLASRLRSAGAVTLLPPSPPSRCVWKNFSLCLLYCTFLGLLSYLSCNEWNENTFVHFLNRLTPNDPYMGRTAPLTSKRCILYIYSTNIGTEYFKRALYSPFFSLQNAVCFIMLTCLVPVLFTFYIQGVLKIKKIIPAPKG